MTEYQLPMKDGEVDFVGIAIDIEDLSEKYNTQSKFVALIESIDANARADERERCEDACQDERALAGEGTDGAYRLDRAILAIRKTKGE